MASTYPAHDGLLDNDNFNITTYDRGLIKSFKLHVPGNNEIDLVDETLSAKIVAPFSVPFLPMFTPKGVGLFMDSTTKRNILNQIRHHAHSNYDLEWKMVRGLHGHIELRVWRSMVFAFCAQWAAEASLFLDSIGNDGHDQKIVDWLDKKAMEHLQANADITDLLSIKCFVRSGNNCYFRNYGTIYFVPFR